MTSSMPLDLDEYLCPSSRGGLSGLAGATRARALLFAALLSLIACGGGAAESARSSGPIEAPDRSAAEDAAMRRLFMLMVEGRMCPQLEGAYVPLPGPDAPRGREAGAEPSAGRMRIDRCALSRRAESFVVTLEGPGWIWVERSEAGPAGATFSLRGHVRFHAKIELEGTLDVSFAESARVVTLWLTPREGVEADVRVTHAVPVAPEGGWSSLVAALGDLVGPSIEERARPMVEREGSAQMSARMSAGFTFTFDLCRSQPDSMVGALANGEVPARPFPERDLVWQANQRVRVRPGGIDVAGPFRTRHDDLRVDLQVEQGAALEVGLYCEAEADKLVRAYLRGERPERWPTALAKRRFDASARLHQLDADGRACPVVLLAFTHGDAPAVFRYRAYERGYEPLELVRCER